MGTAIPKLPKTKKKIQNIVIITAMIYVFGTAGMAFFAPDMLEDDKGNLTAFQQVTLDNSGILIIVIISGAIGAIALDKHNSQNTEVIDKLIEELGKSKPGEG